MSKKPSFTPDESDQVPALTAEDRAWGSGVSTRRISAYPEQSLWNPKEDLLGRTGPSLLLSRCSTLPSTSDFCLQQTTGAQSSTSSATPTGQPSTDSSTQSAKSFLPSGASERKKIPLYSGLVKYFPDALVAVAALSYIGNEQHNAGQPMHWNRAKSMDQEDTLLRHLFESGTVDTDGVRHTTKCAWRALAMLQLEIENAKE